MQAYTWDELRALWEGWAKDGELWDMSEGNPIREWLDGFPKEARPAAALAMTLAKWWPGKEEENCTFNYSSIASCGCCNHFMACRNCPLDGGPTGGSCIDGTHEGVSDFILGKYVEAFEKLPKIWRES